MKARIIKTTLLFVTLLSGILASTAQAQTPYYIVGCRYEWTPECEQQAMEEERFYRSQMLEQAKEQNKILKQNQRLQERQLREQEEQRNQEEMWRLMRQ